MHLSKSPNKKKLLYLVDLVVYPALILILIPFSFSHAGSESDSTMKKDQIKQIETDLSREREQFLKFGTKEKGLLTQLSALEKEIAEKQRFVKDLKEKIRLSAMGLKGQQVRLSQFEHSLKGVEERLGKRLAAFYRYAKRGYMLLFATSRDLDQLRKRMYYLKVIMNEDKRLLQKMTGVKVIYEREISRINEKLAAIKSMKESESSRLSSINGDREKKVILLMRIHKEKEFYEKAVKELQLAAQNLKLTLLGLDKKQKKKEVLPAGFARLKGKLPLPFKGKIRRNNVALGGKSIDAHKGVYIMGPSDAEVKAIYPGRVDYSGLLKGYGQMVVINHGSRFFTVSAYLAKRTPKAGDMVKQGEVIGHSGQTGFLEGPAIYFEMRRAGTNLDPLKWLKVN